MTNWKNIRINNSQIETWTERSALIKVPKSDYKFWHPRKLIHQTSDGYNLGYTDEFTFRVFKNGQGRYNRFEKIDEREWGVDEFEEAFAAQIEHNENFQTKANRDDEFSIVEPEYRAPEQSDVADELKI